MKQLYPHYITTSQAVDMSLRPICKARAWICMSMQIHIRDLW